MISYYTRSDYMKWNVNLIPDLKGKIAIVTGANSGIGFHKAKFLGQKNATVIMAVRSLERGKKAADKILEFYPSANIDVLELDLNDFESIKTFSIEFHKKYKRLDFLFNNAGIMTTPYQKTAQGLESQIGVNHFGHYVLTGLLFDLLIATKDSVVVNTASIAHKFGRLRPNTFFYKKGNRYNKSTAYANSKLANLLFTYKLARLVEKNDLDIRIVASHPGISKTDLGRHIRGKKLGEFFMWIAGIVRQNAEMGSLPALRAAFEGKNGDYFGPRGLGHTKGYPVKHKSSKRSNNHQLQNKLWAESEEITGIIYPFVVSS